MKKLLLSAALVASSLLSFAQTPAVPNGDFENWSTTGSCGPVPAEYISEADLFNESLAECPTASGITKSTNKYSGTYALQLSPLNYIIDMSNGLYSGTSVSDQDGVAFTGRPTKLIGYTKFTKGGTDTLGIFVDLLDNNGDEVGFGELSINSTQAGYTRFELTITYIPTNTNAVSNLGIGFGLGSADNSASANSVALIDGLTFEYPTTATMNFTSTSPINVYAANKNINFSENVSDVNVVDMIGASKMQEASATKTLNAAALTTGMYIVTYKYNDAYFSKKVVIE